MQREFKMTVTVSVKKCIFEPRAHADFPLELGLGSTSLQFPKMPPPEAIAWALLVLLAAPCTGCELGGGAADSGFCTRRYRPETHGFGIEGVGLSNRQWQCRDEDHCMPYCGLYVASYYPVCVPSQRAIERDRNFPHGRHTNHTVLAKDMWVARTAEATIASRPDSLGGKEDCAEAYRRYMCWANFPRCDEEGRSLPMCTSVCENFLRSCRAGRELKRLCHPEKEVGTESNGESASQLLLPGGPFVRNEYLPRSREPSPVCTPSIRGAATGGPTPSRLVWAAAVASSFALALLAAG